MSPLRISSARSTTRVRVDELAIDRVPSELDSSDSMYLRTSLLELCSELGYPRDCAMLSVRVKARFWSSANTSFTDLSCKFGLVSLSRSSTSDGFAVAVF